MKSKNHFPINTASAINVAAGLLLFSFAMQRDIQRHQFYQIGGASSNFGPIYRRGRHIQVGRGLGSTLQSVWRFLAPYLTSSLKSIGAEAARSGAEILSNLDNAPIKDLLIQQRDKSIKNLANKAGEKLMSLNQSGKGLLPYKRVRSDSDSFSPVRKRRRRTTRSKSRKVIKRKTKKRKSAKKKRKPAKRKAVKRKPAKKRKKRTKKVKFNRNSFLDKFLK